MVPVVLKFLLVDPGSNPAFGFLFCEIYEVTEEGYAAMVHFLPPYN